jgi:hypothetical protein
LPYYAERPALDVLGLNDTYIAHLPPTLDTGKPGHEKTDPAYVLGRRPAIIPWFAAPYLIEHPAFAPNYQRASFYGPEGYAVELYLRRDIAHTLKP